MTGPRRVSVADLAGGAVHAPLLDSAGRVHEPLVAVELDGVTEVPGEALERARSGDRLLIGLARGRLSPRVAELARALDLTLVGGGAAGGPECVAVPDPEEPLAALHGAATRNPQAATVLGEVLRATEALPVGAALDVESFAYSALLGGPEFRRWLESRGPRPLPSPVEHPVLVERAGDRLTVTLNRPERRNAYGRQVRDALVDALHLALLDGTVTRVVLAGAGPSFCSGGDLDEFGTAPDLTTAHLVRTRAGAGRLVHALAGQVEARLHGACVGAGIELPAFAGRVTAAAGTTFRLPEVGMGLIPGAGGTVGIPRRIGRHRTLYLALTGAPLDLPTALAWGLVDAADG
ncbi:enoyl-CoA hydratase/isomerase family protein [Actinomadura craniellae]|uniref:enoyl-CoA hydratase/isomerase family protein n=1 Tax=Actinomadura craniellae TaxID=2231787 RepID=UPI0018F1988C|nr:enoyl-CoA hydratase/isomerase family protein [Actinomadura craniellae]